MKNVGGREILTKLGRGVNLKNVRGRIIRTMLGGRVIQTKLGREGNSNKIGEGNLNRWREGNLNVGYFPKSFSQGSKW